jgi:hypothetical protein
VGHDAYTKPRDDNLVVGPEARKHDACGQAQHSTDETEDAHGQYHIDADQATAGQREHPLKASGWAPNGFSTGARGHSPFAEVVAEGYDGGR